jgi:hypothetical protein
LNTVEEAGFASVTVEAAFSTWGVWLQAVTPNRIANMIEMYFIFISFTVCRRL